MRFSLIIVTKARAAPLRAALESSARALASDGEVIVVDGDPERSADEVVREIASEHPDLDLRYVPSKAGMTLQRNVGIDAARGEVVVFVDDDCTFEPGLFEALAGAYADPAVVGATGRIDAPSRFGLFHPHSRLRLMVFGGGHRGARQGTMTPFGSRRPIVDLEQPRDIEFMPGPLMSARRDLAAEVRFDERLGSYAVGEDDDFSYRISRHGRIRYEPAALVYHHELGWRAQDRRQVDRLQVVNRTYIFRKNFPQTLRARAAFGALLALLCCHRIVNREWAGLRGLLEGIRQVRHSGATYPEPPAGGENGALEHGYELGR